MNANATYTTHYANHADERCEVLDRTPTPNGSILAVLFADGSTMMISPRNIVLDAGIEI